MIFKGAGVALITPFTKDLEVDFSKLEELIEFHIKNNTDAIIVCGTTGESSTLSNDEKKKVFKFSVNVAKKRIPIIAGTGSNNTKTSCELSKYAESVGVDGLLLVTPYYNKCSQEGLFMHYKTIANSVTIPCILYNVPGRTCVNILPETVLELSKISNIVGIKDAASNIEQTLHMFSILPDDFCVYSGNDDQTYTFLTLGASGVISVASNILPNEVHEICNSFFNGDYIKSRSLQFKYLNIMKNMFIDVNPIPVKEALNILNFNVGGFRLPLCNTSSINKEKITNSLKAVGLL